MSGPGIRLLTGGDLEIDPALGTDLAGPLPRALFVALLLIGTEPVSREYLATLLWPEADATTVRQRLRKTLHNLKRSLGPLLRPALASTPDALSMDCASVGVGVDLAEFQQHSSGGTTESRRRAIALYKGNLLERFPPISANFDELLEHRREACRAAFLSVCRRALSADVGAGDVAAYDLMLEKALRIEPTNADLVAEAMRFYAAAGSVQRVIEVFDRHERALRSDIDVNPEPEIVALRDEMRALALKRLHAREPPPAPKGPEEARDRGDPAPSPAQSRDRLFVGAVVVLVIAAAGVWAWRAATAGDRVFLMMPVAETSGDCGLPEARTVFDHATEAAVTSLEGALVVLAGANASGEMGSADVFTVAREVDCNGPNARGNLTVARERNNEIFLLRRYDLRSAREDVLAKTIRSDLNEAMPR